MRILCFGDSNTYGYDPRGFSSDRYDICWCDLLAGMTGWDVINGGSNGRMLPGSDRWIDTYLTKYSPVDQILIMMGSNDILRGHTLKQILRDMAAFLDHIQTQWPQVAVTLLSPPPISLWEENFDTMLQEVTDGYRSLASQRAIPFVDIRTWGLSMAYDGVHLSEKGHREFAEKSLSVFMIDR